MRLQEEIKTIQDENSRLRERLSGSEAEGLQFQRRIQDLEIDLETKVRELSRVRVDADRLGILVKERDVSLRDRERELKEKVPSV